MSMTNAAEIAGFTTALNATVSMDLTACAKRVTGAWIGKASEASEASEAEGEEAADERICC